MNAEKHIDNDYIIFWMCQRCRRDFDTKREADDCCQHELAKQELPGRAKAKPLTQKQKAGLSIVTPQQAGVKRTMRGKRQI